jgi:hypothetical protein
MVQKRHVGRKQHDRKTRAFPGSFEARNLHSIDNSPGQILIPETYQDPPRPWSGLTPTLGGSPSNAVAMRSRGWPGPFAAQCTSLAAPSMDGHAMWLARWAGFASSPRRISQTLGPPLIFRTKHRLAELAPVGICVQLGFASASPSSSPQSLCVPQLKISWLACAPDLRPQVSPIRIPNTVEKTGLEGPSNAIKYLSFCRLQHSSLIHRHRILCRKQEG